MKLYNLDHSPYATRVRILIAHAGIPMEVMRPPVALRTEEFSARFPLGKIPVLELDDGGHLSDSWVIMEYLASQFPESSLLPQEPMARAAMQSVARCADTCLGPDGVFPLFAAAADPESAGPALEGLQAEMVRLDRVLAAQGDPAARSLHLGDIALAPHISYAQLLAQLFEVEDPVASRAAVATWWSWVNGHPAVSAELQRMQDAARAFFGG